MYYFCHSFRPQPDMYSKGQTRFDTEIPRLNQATLTI